MKSEDKVIRFNEYTQKLLEKRQKEIIHKDILNEFHFQKEEKLTSPTTSTSTEEARLLMEYMERFNLLQLQRKDQQMRKIVILKKFFKMKRNQQVVIFSKCGSHSIYTEGKVNAIGRDFVMLTNLRERIWIPFSAIHSANIPFGQPSYTNSHQHYIYDNDLRKKLLLNFGETVAKRDILKQQFYEESLQTNLNVWKDLWVEVRLDDKKQVGKIIETNKTKLVLGLLNKREEILLKHIHYIKTMRLLTMVAQLFNNFHRLKKI
ncbi:hypothetical protein [Halalkalibacterium ligniniphilum]|uniref:hypothetical protein n=1 Tax=Halalkalibacterium ligniniphilum TaxID=1134413 RepID=UPI00034BA40B|nr:hypothetical protein [Halalkalibacterium ligniniphilum]